MHAYATTWEFASQYWGRPITDPHLMAKDWNKHPITDPQLMAKDWNQSPAKQYTLEELVTNKSFLVPDGQLDHKAIQEVSTSTDHQSSTGSAGNTPCALLHMNLKLPKGLSLFCPPSSRHHCEQERPGRRPYCLISLQKSTMTKDQLCYLCYNISVQHSMPDPATY